MEKYQYGQAEFALLEGTRVPLAIYQYIDQHVVAVVLSAGFLDLFGYTDRKAAYDLMDNDMYHDTHPDDVSRVSEAAFQFATQGGIFNETYRTRVGDGYKIVHATGEHIFADTGERLAVVWYLDEGMFRENAEIESDLNQRLVSSLHRERMYRENYDSMTGLPNMTYFFKLAEVGREKMLAKGHTMALLFIDLIGVKHFNSKYGFLEGNKLLIEYAKLFASLFGYENSCRFGQDHFALFTDEEGLEEKLSKMMEESGNINGGRSLPIRVGIYLDEDGQEDISFACDKARAACEFDRSSYASYYKYFDDDLKKEFESRQYIIDNIDRAIEEGWIKVYFQPIVRAANGRVCDEEALARWQDPERGMLSPAEFIPVLEDARLIYKLDLHMVDLVIQKVKMQEEEGLFVVPTSVNLSRSDFDSCDVVEEIRRRVDDAGLGRDKLTIEITESIVGSDFDFMKEQIERFQALGFQVWMDDFGSGYSSLDVLHSIRFDTIKFDMSFMRKFDDGENSRIILTELIKMAIALDVETLCEGVETEEQLSFLREVGCNKLQGYYYCKPIPPDEIRRRYREGRQIGFENPEESGYFSAIGGVNLYDLSAIAHEERESLQRYFDTIPMAIIETDGANFEILRSNQSYRAFMDKMVNIIPDGPQVNNSEREGQDGADFLFAVKKCGREGGRLVLDEELSDGTVTHAVIRRIAVNPVTKSAAVAVAVLAVADPKEEGDGVSFVRIARTLAADYFNLFYVDLNTEQFIEYTSDDLYGTMAMERHGDNFFKQSRADAKNYLDERDQEGFVQAFTKENVIRSMDENGSFTHTYRLKTEDGFIYANMKAVRLLGDQNHMIIGVSSVDAQMRAEKELEKVSEERATYSRIAALAGDYLAIYKVNPYTGEYVEYSARNEYTTLGHPRRGKDFFEEARVEIRSSIYPKDLEMFLERFTMENIMEEIEQSGNFRLEYRLLINSRPTWVRLKAVIIEEKTGKVLMVGLNVSRE